MNKKLALKLGIDLIMTIIMIILMSFRLTGLVWPEILGVGVLLMILSHNLINVKWIIAMTKTIGKRLDYKTYIKIILNLAMAVVTIIMGISSVMISKSLFAFLGIQGGGTWKYLHNLSAYSLLILVSIHVGVHWKMIMRGIRNMLHLQENNKVRTFILRILAFLLAVLGVKSSFDRGIAGQFIPPVYGNRPHLGDGFEPGEKGQYQRKNREKNENLEQEDGQLNHQLNYQDTLEAIPLTATNTRTRSSQRGQELDQISSSNPEVQEGESLNDYLGRLICTGCGRQCSLLSPSCGRGYEQSVQATNYYESVTSGQATMEEETTTEDNITEDNTTENNITEDNTTENNTTEDTQDTTNELEEDTEEEFQGDSNNLEGEEAFGEGPAVRNGKIQFELEKGADNSIFGVFSDYVPILGLYIAGTYYTIEIIEKVKKRKKEEKLATSSRKE